MKTIVIGLGNPILGDDGVGWKVAEEVKKFQGKGDRGKGMEVDVEFLSLGGLSLMEHLIGYERAILIDAILIDAVASNGETGSLIVSKLSDLPDYSALHTTSTHDTSLQNALRLGKAMGAELPEEIIVVGIATNRIYDFSEELSAPVMQVLPKAVNAVLKLLK